MWRLPCGKKISCLKRGRGGICEEFSLSAQKGPIFHTHSFLNHPFEEQILTPFLVSLPFLYFINHFFFREFESKYVTQRCWSEGHNHAIFSSLLPCQQNQSISFACLVGLPGKGALSPLSFMHKRYDEPQPHLIVGGCETILFGLLLRNEMQSIQTAEITPR